MIVDRPDIVDVNPVTPATIASERSEIALSELATPNRVAVLRNITESPDDAEGKFLKITTRSKLTHVGVH